MIPARRGALNAARLTPTVVRPVPKRPIGPGARDARGQRRHRPRRAPCWRCRPCRRCRDPVPPGCDKDRTRNELARATDPARITPHHVRNPRNMSALATIGKAVNRSDVIEIALRGGSEARAPCGRSRLQRSGGLVGHLGRLPPRRALRRTLSRHGPIRDGPRGEPTPARPRPRRGAAPRCRRRQGRSGPRS